jgi:hypothetical protein
MFSAEWPLYILSQDFVAQRVSLLCPLTRIHPKSRILRRHDCRILPKSRISRRRSRYHNQLILMIAVAS